MLKVDLQIVPDVRDLTLVQRFVNLLNQFRLEYFKDYKVPPGLYQASTYPINPVVSSIIIMCNDIDVGCMEVSISKGYFGVQTVYILPKYRHNNFANLAYAAIEKLAREFNSKIFIEVEESAFKRNLAKWPPLGFTHYVKNTRDNNKYQETTIALIKGPFLKKARSIELDTCQF